MHFLILLIQHVDQINLFVNNFIILIILLKPFLIHVNQIYEKHLVNVKIIHFFYKNLIFLLKIQVNHLLILDKMLIIFHKMVILLNIQFYCIEILESINVNRFQIDLIDLH